MALTKSKKTTQKSTVLIFLALVAGLLWHFFSESNSKGNKELSSLVVSASEEKLPVQNTLAKSLIEKKALPSAEQTLKQADSEEFSHPEVVRPPKVEGPGFPAAYFNETVPQNFEPLPIKHPKIVWAPACQNRYGSTDTAAWNEKNGHYMSEDFFPIDTTLFDFSIHLYSADYDRFIQLSLFHQHPKEERDSWDQDSLVFLAGMNIASNPYFKGFQRHYLTDTTPIQEVFEKPENLVSQKQALEIVKSWAQHLMNQGYTMTSRNYLAGTPDGTGDFSMAQMVNGTPTSLQGPDYGCALKTMPNETDTKTLQCNCKVDFL